MVFIAKTHESVFVVDCAVILSTTGTIPRVITIDSRLARPIVSYPFKLLVANSFDDDVDWAAIEQIEAAHTSAKEAEDAAAAAAASSQASGAASRTASQVASASDANAGRAAMTCTTVGDEEKALAPWSAFASASVAVSLSQAWAWASVRVAFELG